MKSTRSYRQVFGPTIQSTDPRHLRRRTVWSLKARVVDAVQQLKLKAGLALSAHQPRDVAQRGPQVVADQIHARFANPQPRYGH